MAPVVYLHVGAPKTGTSFLQDVMWTHREVLAQEGVRLPGTRRGVYQATVDVRELPLEKRSPGVAGAWQRLVDEVMACSGTAVVSHELFAGASEQQARRALTSLAQAETHIVYTARDLARQIPAEWQQRIKHRRSAPMGKYVAHVVSGGPLAGWFWHVQDPAGVLSRWGGDVPPERLHLITVPPSGADPTLLWRRFASLIGVDADRYDTAAARANLSLGAAEAELLRRVNLALGNRLPLPGPHNRLIKDLLGNEVLAKLDGKVRFGMRADRQEWLTDEAQRIVDEIRKLDCHVIGDLDELLPGPYVPSADPDDVGDAALANVGIQALVAVLERMHEQTVRVQDVQRHARRKRAEAARLRSSASSVQRDVTSIRAELRRTERTAAALRAELRTRRNRPVKQAVIDLSRKHRSLMTARRYYWRAVNAVRRWRAR